MASGSFPAARTAACVFGRSRRGRACTGSKLPVNRHSQCDLPPPSPDGRFAVSAGWDHNVRIWKLPGKGWISQSLKNTAGEFLPPSRALTGRPAGVSPAVRRPCARSARWDQRRRHSIAGRPENKPFSSPKEPATTLQTIRSWLEPARKAAQPRSRPHLEELESRLTPSVIGEDFRISNVGPDGDTSFGAMPERPSVAFNAGDPDSADDDQYLVVWTAGREISGQLVNAATGTPIAADFRIAGVGLDSGLWASHPAIAYNSADQQYMVVWASNDDPSGGVAIFAQRLDASGERIGGGRYIISDGMPTNLFAFNPTLVYNPVDNEYLVAWEAQLFQVDGSSEYEIFGQRLEGDTGAQIGADFRISDMGPEGDFHFGAGHPAVAHNSHDNEYLVVWSCDDAIDEELEVFGQRLNANGTQVGSNDFRISDMGPDGNVLFDAFSPAVAYNSLNNEYLVVWSGHDGIDHDGIDVEFEIYGQRLAGATGAELGANDFRISHLGLEGDTSFEAASPAVAYNGITNEYLVVWHGDDNTAPLVNGEFEIFGQAFVANPASFGAATPNNFRISHMGPNGNTSYEAKFPALATNSREYLVIWQGDDDTPPVGDDEFEIFGQRVGLIDRTRAIYDAVTHRLDIYGSSAGDEMSLSADPKGNIVITAGGLALKPTDPKSGQPAFPTLLNTQSIGVYLRDGDDSFDLTSAGFQAIATAIIGEEGDDTRSCAAGERGPNAGLRRLGLQRVPDTTLSKSSGPTKPRSSN